MGMSDQGSPKVIFRDLSKALTIASLPRTSKVINFEARKERIKKVLEHSPENIQKTLATMTRAIVDRSQFQNAEGRGVPVRTNYFFLGAPGVGKTHLVRQYAKALGVPLYRVDLSSPESIKALVKKPERWSRDDSSTPNPLVSAFMKVPSKDRYNNGIIFFDEIDKAIKSSSSSSSFSSDHGTSNSLTQVLQVLLIPKKRT